MVTYNSGKFIKDAITSVLNSTYRNVELIISDDCSKDDTWEVINSFKDSRIRAYRNSINIGEYPNRNKCIDHARGEYILFIDGDDMIYPHGLDVMVRMLDKFPQCGMALMRWYKKNLFYPVIVTPEKFYEGIFFNYGFNDIAFANTFFRAQVLKEVGGIPVKYRAGDNFIRLLIGKHKPTLLINDGLTWWRETPNQASARHMFDITRLFEEVEMELSMLNEKDCPLKERDRTLAKKNIDTRILRTLMQFLKRGLIKEVLKALKHYNIPIYNLFRYRRKFITRDPFFEYSPERPYTAT
jgi:glycosyltransferase involved in cell wall biosynthesis